MSQILYTNLNDRWSSYAMGLVQNERLVRRDLESRTPDPAPLISKRRNSQTAQSLACYEQINLLDEPFTSRDLFRRVWPLHQQLSLRAIMSWMAQRKRSGDVEVVTARHRYTDADGNRAERDSTYRRTRTPLKPR